MTIISPGTKDGREAAVNLIMESTEAYWLFVFSAKIAQVLSKLYSGPTTIFGRRFYSLIVADNQIQGALLSFTLKDLHRTEWLLTILMFCFLGIKTALRHMKRIYYCTDRIGRFAPHEYYVSNIAIDEQSRHRGFGTRLMQRAEEMARRAGLRKIVLDVETSKTAAIALYTKLGYKIERQIDIDLEERFSFYRMGKEL